MPTDPANEPLEPPRVDGGPPAGEPAAPDRAGGSLDPDAQDALRENLAEFFRVLLEWDARDCEAASAAEETDHDDT